MNFLNVACVTSCESDQSSVFLFAQMLRKTIKKWMQKDEIGFGLPVITLELIARMTTINKVVEVIRSSVSARLKVVKGSFRANIILTYPAIATTKFITATHCLPQLFSHDQKITALRTRDFSASRACRSR